MTTFAIDYHGTFSTDIAMFRNLIALLQSRGNIVVIVTDINDGTAWANEIRRNVDGLAPIVSANGAWKEEAAKRAGYNVDVWIDDHPEGIRRPTAGFIESRDRYTKEGV